VFRRILAATFLAATAGIALGASPAHADPTVSVPTHFSKMQAELDPGPHPQLFVGACVSLNVQWGNETVGDLYPLVTLQDARHRGGPWHTIASSSHQSSTSFISELDDGCGKSGLTVLAYSDAPSGNPYYRLVYHGESYTDVDGSGNPFLTRFLPSVSAVMRAVRDRLGPEAAKSVVDADYSSMRVRAVDEILGTHYGAGSERVQAAWSTL
jgi:hypothetical protein